MRCNSTVWVRLRSAAAVTRSGVNRSAWMAASNTPTPYTPGPTPQEALFASLPPGLRRLHLHSSNLYAEALAQGTRLTNLVQLKVGCRPTTCHASCVWTVDHYLQLSCRRGSGHLPDQPGAPQGNGGVGLPRVNLDSVRTGGDSMPPWLPTLGTCLATCIAARTFLGVYRPVCLSLYRL